jgi:hypothetical protein
MFQFPRVPVDGVLDSVDIVPEVEVIEAEEFLEIQLATIRVGCVKVHLQGECTLAEIRPLCDLGDQLDVLNRRFESYYHLSYLLAVSRYGRAGI